MDEAAGIFEIELRFGECRAMFEGGPCFGL
jgi:hypothetical protein